MLTEAIALASYKVQNNQSDLVLRPHQVMIFWLLAVQNWLNYHLYTLRGLFKLSHDIKAQSPQVCPKLLHNKKGNSAEAIRYLLKELHSSPRGEEREGGGVELEGKSLSSSRRIRPHGGNEKKNPGFCAVIFLGSIFPHLDLGLATMIAPMTSQIFLHFCNRIPTTIPRSRSR